MTFVVVGGGPTGVKLSGAIGELAPLTLAKDFRNIDPSSTRVILIEGGSRLLPSFPEHLSDRAEADLVELGVSIWTKRIVTDVRAEGVQIGATFVASHCVIWTAGVKPSPSNRVLEPKDFVRLDARGAPPVNPDLALKNSLWVSVLGD